MHIPVSVYGVGGPGPPDPLNPNSVQPYRWPPPATLPIPTISLGDADDLQFAVAKLVTLGLSATNSLRLLAICDWDKDRAFEVVKACKLENVWDILGFARELREK
jgi:hypothetical protein